MNKEIQVRILLDEEDNKSALIAKAAKKLQLNPEEITGIKVLRKSIDARNNPILFNYKITI